MLACLSIITVACISLACVGVSDTFHNAAGADFSQGCSLAGSSQLQPATQNPCGRELVVRIDWTADVLVFRTSGIDAEVQREETRLVDLEALKALRGGLGESYRRSLVTILESAPDGLTFRELVAAIRHRQNHEVHRGTIRALLSTAGFIQHDGHWTVSTTPEEGGRRLRGAITVAFLPPGTGDDPGSRVRAIRSRLRELVEALQSERLTCQRCGSGNVLPIQYGLPGPEMFDAAQRGEIVLGGCIVSPDNPDTHCGACAFEWQAHGSGTF
jgi:hypothetical protein